MITRSPRATASGSFGSAAVGRLNPAPIAIASGTADDLHPKRTMKPLPALHGDPFDRLLVAQALEEELILVTADELVEYVRANVRRYARVIDDVQGWLPPASGRTCSGRWRHDFF